MQKGFSGETVNKETTCKN